MDNKLLLNATLDEFVQAMAQAIGMAANGESCEDMGNAQVKKHYVYGLAGLMQLLSCSKTTAYRIKKSGVLDPAISQNGRILVIDADLALDLLHTKKIHARKHVHY